MVELIFLYFESGKLGLNFAPAFCIINISVGSITILYMGIGRSLCMKWGAFMGKKQNRNAGFSLVELIIVVAIMAVLVGVIAPQWLKYVERSRRVMDVQNA